MTADTTRRYKFTTEAKVDDFRWGDTMTADTVPGAKRYPGDNTPGEAEAVLYMLGLILDGRIAQAVVFAYLNGYIDENGVPIYD